MTTFKHLLAATDFSGTSMCALEMTARLAERLGASVTLIHSFDPAPLGPAAAHLSLPREVAKMQEQLEESARRELGKSRNTLFRGVDRVELAAVADANPALAVCQYAADHNADLIVVGAHGQAHLTRWLIGGVAEKIARRATCSVLAVRPSPSGGVPMPQSLLVGTDFSPACEPAVKVSAALAKELEARVALAYCYDSAVPMLPPAGAPELQSPERQADQARSDLCEALAELARARFDDDVRVTAELLVSRNPAASLCSYADDRAVDLIVVGAQGRTGHDRQFIGGVAEKVLRHASCSVLTVRR